MESIANSGSSIDITVQRRHELMNKFKDMLKPETLNEPF